MRIQFCGADRTVTGSCHLIEVNGLRLLLDVGMYQGPRELANRLNHFLPADVHQVDAVILSHGHLDHCGKLPVVVRDDKPLTRYFPEMVAALAKGKGTLRDNAELAKLVDAADASQPIWGVGKLTPALQS